MPYHWTETTQTAPESLTLWPHRSLSPKGFVWFIGATSALLALPLVTQLGTAGLWMLLPFLVAAVGGIWLALRISYRTDSESLTLTETELTLTRHRPGRADQVWQANPYWVTPSLHRNGPVPDYLTLSGNGRTVELGAFLTAEERRDLYDRLHRRLIDLRRAVDVTGGGPAPDEAR